MNKFLVLPSPTSLVALFCCSTTILWCPFSSLGTKFVFFVSALLCSHLSRPIHTISYLVLLVITNFVFFNDAQLWNAEQWIYPFLTTNSCAIGLYIVCKEISEWNILDYLSNKEIWKALPDITFIDADDYSPPLEKPSQLTRGVFSHLQRELKPHTYKLGEFIKTDFKVDINGGVQGLLQTSTKALKYGETVLGYIKVVTEVQLPQSSLYDLFTSIDGSESVYKELFGHGLDHSRLLLDAKGNVVSWNPGVQKVKGYTREEVLGKHISMFYTIEDRVAGRPLADLVMAHTEGHLEMEGWMLKKDGDMFWANMNLTAIYNNSEQLLGFSEVTRDCTEKKKSLDALKATEEKYHLLVSSVTDYTLIMLNRNGIITTWNSGAQKINGYHAEEVIGRHFSIFYDAEALAEKKPEKEMEIAIRDGRFEEEAWRVKKDGTRFYANVVLSAIYSARKDIVGFAKVTRDITDKLTAEAAQEQLRIAEEKYQLLIGSVRDYSIFMLDPEGTIISWNQGAQRIKGYTAEEVIGRHFSIMYTPEDRANGKPASALSTAATEGRFEDLEGLRVRKDGTTFWANVIITAIRDKTGSLVGFSKVTRDVTERRHTELALRSAMQSAQAAALAKQSFLAMMSHEIRTPLHAVITLSHLLQNSELNPMQRDYLETIHSSSKQLLGIINDILDFSKIESGKMELVLKPFDLRQCVEETIDLVLIKPLTTKSFNQIDVVYIFSPGVPECIISDAVRVRQILMNYLSNAVKFTEKGEVVVKISCEAVEPKENNTVKLTFAVHDTGIGIKSPNLDDLFQPFFQINADAPQVFGGTGLGLVISKKLSQLMGGNVWVESQEGIGSTFYFSITAQIEPNASPPPSPLNSSFLVVDSSEAGADALKLILEKLGCSARCAHDHTQAQELMLRYTFDAVFITRTLHSQTSECATRLHAHCPLYLTGTPDASEYHSTAVPSAVPRSELFTAFLPKPYRTDIARTLVRSLRGKKGLSVSIAKSSPSTSPLASPCTPSQTNLRILVAEDNVVNRKVASRILERLGYFNYDMVENGKEVLTAMESKVYDVILMDIQMPQMDGWTATQEIFKLYPPGRCPTIIAMTAYAYEHDQQRCAQLGMKAHIAKPVDMVYLAELLRSCPMLLV